MMEITLQRYGDFRPTGFDRRGLGLPDRQCWLVGPCSRTRDSGILAESNFESLLKALGGESDTVEVHRFGHWGPGWFEIIIIDPDSPQAIVAQEIANALENYPVVDESDYSEREWLAITDCWYEMNYQDKKDLCLREGVTIKAARFKQFPPSEVNGDCTDRLWERISQWVN